LDGGRRLLATHLDEVVALIRAFQKRVNFSGNLKRNSDIKGRFTHA